MIPVAFAAYWVWAIGAGSKYIEYNLVNQARHVERASSAAFSPWATLMIEGKRNVFFSGLCLFGFAYSAVGVLRAHIGATVNRDQLSPDTLQSEKLHLGKLVIVLWLAVFTVASLWINPFPFPYFHVIALPGGAVLGSCSLHWLTQRWQGSRPWLGGTLGVAALGFALVTSLPRLLDKAVDRTTYQLAFIDQVHAATPPGSAVFDLAGLHFRRDPYPIYVTTMATLKRYKGGAYPRMVPLLRTNHVAAVVRNYRTESLGPEEKAFFEAHFTPYTHYLLLPGCRINDMHLGDKQSFEVLDARVFRFVGTGQLLIDDHEFGQGVLQSGFHTLTTREPVLNGRLMVDAPPPFLDDQSLASFLYPTFD
jgi:hypothetical protein